MKVDDLTIVIITNRNDQRFIDSLASSQFAQEVIVVDNNSENEWPKLKEKYHFSLLEHSHIIDNFSSVRNKALESVKTTWVFFLDSDEVLPKQAAKEIKSIIQLNLYDAVSIKRLDHFLGKPLRFGEAGSIELVRLFKVKKGTFIRNVHETLNFTGRIGEAEFHILHYPHNSIQDFLEKIAHYAYLESLNRNDSIVENKFQMYTYPIGKFIVNYFLKLGFLDGYRGFIYALLMSLHSFYVRVFYYEQQKKL